MAETLLKPPLGVPRDAVPPLPPLSQHPEKRPEARPKTPLKVQNCQPGRCTTVVLVSRATRVLYREGYVHLLCMPEGYLGGYTGLSLLAREVSFNRVLTPGLIPPGL